MYGGEANFDIILPIVGKSYHLPQMYNPRCAPCRSNFPSDILHKIWHQRMSSLKLRFLESQNLGKPGSLEELLDVFLGLGMEISYLHLGDFASDPLAFWPTYNEEARKGLHLAYAKQKLHFLILAQYDNQIMVAWVHLTWSNSSAGDYHSGKVSLSSDDTSIFTQRQYNSEENSTRLLNLAMLLYNCLSPKFGWIEHSSRAGYLRGSDVENLTIPCIYWANFFGPDYVKKFGQQYFLQAPGWKCEILGDGGCLYVLASDMGRKKAGTKALEREVASYFGVTTVRRKAKKRKKSVPRQVQQRKPDPRWDFTGLSEEEIVDRIFQLLSEKKDRPN